MPIKYQDPITKTEHKLTWFKGKSEGKNKSPIDGFYQSDKNPGARYFVKKPKDKCEAFAELLAGKILAEIISRQLVDKVYFPSLIVADAVKLADGSYALIQSMIDFTPLYEIIGTQLMGGRSALKEMAAGPQAYANLINLEKYFGLSIALFFSLVLGAHSVHSGNIVARKDIKSMVGQQYARLDWGDAFRNFARKENNENILSAYENQGFLNYKKLTKEYFLNYKCIKGLFPAMAEKASNLNISEEAWADIVGAALKNIPADFLGTGSEAQKNKELFAKYISLDSFKNVQLGPTGNAEAFVRDMANVLNNRVKKIAELEDLASSKNDKKYASQIAFSLAFSMDKNVAFPDLMAQWEEIWSHHQGYPVDSLKLDDVDLDELKKSFNSFIGELALKAEAYNVWQHDEQSTVNMFVEYNTAKHDEVQMGSAFVPHYKESVIFKNLSLLGNDKGAVRFKPYEEPAQQYTNDPKHPDSAWENLSKLATYGQGVFNAIRIIKEASQLDPNMKKEVLTQSLTMLNNSLNPFILANHKVNDLFKGQPLPSDGAFFYEIDDESLGNMAGVQLATICFEELNHSEPSVLLVRIVNDDALWGKLAESWNQLFVGRLDGPQEKVAKLQLWRNLLLEKDLTKIPEGDKLLKQQLDLIVDEIKQKNSLEGQIKNIEQGLAVVQTAIDKFNKELATRRILLQDANGDITTNLVLVKRLQKQLGKLPINTASDEVKKKVSTLQTELGACGKKLADFEQIIKDSIASEEKFARLKGLERQITRDCRIAVVKGQINALQFKANNLAARKEILANETITQLIENLNVRIDNYINSNESEEEAVKTFRQEALQDLRNANSVLGHPRQQWKYVLANISLAILLVGVGYLAATLIHKKITGNYTFFSKTQSQEQLEQLSETISNFKPLNNP